MLPTLACTALAAGSLQYLLMFVFRVCDLYVLPLRKFSQLHTQRGGDSSYFVKPEKTSVCCKIYHYRFIAQPQFFYHKLLLLLYWFYLTYQNNLKNSFKI